MYRTARYSERHEETLNVVVEQRGEQTSQQTGAMRNVTSQTERGSRNNSCCHCSHYDQCQQVVTFQSTYLLRTYLLVGRCFRGIKMRACGNNDEHAQLFLMLVDRCTVLHGARLNIPGRSLMKRC